jgi:hypothetical protein
MQRRERLHTHDVTLFRALPSKAEHASQRYGSRNQIPVSARSRDGFDGVPGGSPGQRLRLVLYYEFGEAQASLYPMDANAFSPALFSFALRPDQELPVLAPGDPVDVEGSLEKGAMPVIHAGQIDILPAKGLRAGGAGRIFAERGAVIAHPSVIGWQPTWRYVTPSSLDPVAGWEHRLRRQIRTGTTMAIIFVVYLGVVAGSLTTGHVPNVGPIVSFGGCSGAGVIVSWWLALRSRRALKAARLCANQPAQPMTMTLAWTAGYGQGPMAIASLYPPNQPGGAPVAQLGVVNVPAGFAPDGPVNVEVHGDPTAAPVIDCGDVQLWPAEHAHLAVGTRRYWRGPPPPVQQRTAATSRPG